MQKFVEVVDKQEYTGGKKIVRLDAIICLEEVTNTPDVAGIIKLNNGTGIRLGKDDYLKVKELLGI